MSLRDIIFEALNNSVENGYEPDFLKLTPTEICMDLLYYCADVENNTVEEIYPHVLLWLKEKGMVM